MGRVVLIAFLPTFVVLLANLNPVYTITDQLLRPQTRQMERLEYQISLLLETEDAQIAEIESLKTEKNINLEIVASTDQLARELEQFKD
mgnify:CR=1 FL=1